MGQSAAVYTHRRGVERTKRLIAVLAVIYSAAACVFLLTLQNAPATRTFPDWMAIPLQVLATFIAGVVAVGQRRSANNSWVVWALVSGFSAMSLVATYMWNEFRVMGSDRMLSFADACYFVDYGLMTMAYAVAYRGCGGSFRSIRTWLDALTILVAMLAIFWATLLGPFNPPGQSQPMGILFGGAYVVSLSMLITMASMLFLRLPRVRERPVQTLLIVAGLVDMIWEIAWLSSWLRQLDFIGLFYNAGDVICFTLIICAAALTPQTSSHDRESASADRIAYTFLPTLSALLATALIAVYLASTRAADVWILVGLILLTGVLLVARQAAVRRELASLNRALSTLAADTRLTELVRQSADAFLVVDSRGIITFASPASGSVLHLDPQQLQGTSALLLLGTAHEVALGGFLGRLVREPAPPGPLEVTVASHPGIPRMLRISGANQLANPHIEGLALTITDISALRSLERDVLEIANQERLRLASDVHEGLGQQLIGIKMMLQGAVKAPDTDPVRQKEYLEMIVDQMGGAISGVRDLARGLSPMYVVGGSLGGALQRLGKDSSSDTPVHVAVDSRFDDRIVGDFPADHLFRIAKEAVQNATRHSGCTQASIDLQLVQDHVVLAVSDNGCGCEYLPHTSNGLGLRMMDYRARVIGGSFSIGRHAQAGTLVQVTVPLRMLSPVNDSRAVALLKA